VCASIARLHVVSALPQTGQPGGISSAGQSASPPAPPLCVQENPSQHTAAGSAVSLLGAAEEH
jgi:hypothetical protein